VNRSTSGLAPINWRLQAACRGDNAELFFQPATRATALHICRTHCPVLEQCRREALAHPPVALVMGGLAWRSTSGSLRPRPLKNKVRPASSCHLCAPPDPPPDPTRRDAFIAGLLAEQGHTQLTREREQLLAEVVAERYPPLPRGRR
jgi:hypothetical protein